MLEGVSGLLTYLFLKLTGYTVWSYVGLFWFDPNGGSQRERLWRFAGILVSYMADAPFLIHEGGFPQGRLFC
jgi:hypothetical protein